MSFGYICFNKEDWQSQKIKSLLVPLVQLLIIVAEKIHTKSDHAY